MASQHDTYLRELQKAHASLQEFHKSLTSFKLYGTTGGHVMYMSKTLEERTLTLEYAHKELKILRGPHGSLSQQLREFVFTNLEAIVEYFENALQKLEHFYPQLIISREKVRQDKSLQDGQIASILE